MPYNYTIQEFYGIQQHKDGSLLPPGTASDARNVDTSDGNLRLAKGFTKAFSYQWGDGTEGKPLRLLMGRYNNATKFYVVTEGGIFAKGASSWTKIKTFSPTISGQVSYIQNRIGTVDYLIVAFGQRMLKIKLSDDSVTDFGSADPAYTGTVSSYSTAALRIVLGEAITDEQKRCAVANGVTVVDSDGGERFYEVSNAYDSGGATRLQLKYKPDVNPAASDTVKIRGGGSTASARYLGLYSGRLFAAGDPTAKNRLYWSAVTGNGRTCEDWLSVEGSVDASGGYVEVGENTGDSIIGLCVLTSSMLIFKSHSVYRLYGDRPSTFSLERVEENTEDMSNAGVVVRYDTPQYLTRSGIKYYDGSGILPLNSGERVLRDFMASVASISASKGLHCDNMLYFTCRTGSGSYDDAVIVYDITRRSFMIRDGFEVADFAVDDGEIYFINADRYLYHFLDGYDYNGSPISAYWKTQPTDLQVKGYKKQIRCILFRGQQGRVLFTIEGGGKKAYDWRNLQRDNDGFVMLGVSTDKSRVFSIEIRNDAGSYFEITGGMEIDYISELAVKT